MAESIMIGLHAVFPLMVYMALGIVVKQRGMVGDKTLEEMNKVTFRLFMFCLIFMNSYQVDASRIFTPENGRTLILALLALAVIILGGLWGAARCLKEPKKRTVVVQACYRSNLVLFGLPISMAIFGEGDLGVVSILIAVVVPIYNIVAVFLLEHAAKGRGRMANPLLMVVKNPLVLGSVLGLSCSLLGLRLPQLIEDTMGTLGKVATPLAFFILGGSLIISDVRRNLPILLSVCAVRLLCIPAAILGIAIWLGIDGLHLAALLSAFASPVAVSSFTMAKELKVEPDLAGELVAVTTLGSIVTMFGWIVTLSSLGLF